MMRRLDRILFGTIAAVMIAFILGGVLVTTAAPRGDIYEYLTNFREVLHLVNSSYVDDVEAERLMTGAFKGMMESLDSSSVYLDPAQHTRYRKGLAGSTDTLGLTISKRYTYGVIVSVAPDSPAARGGLRAGDLIRSIDGKMVREMNRLEVEEALQGEAETEVVLSVIYQKTAERDEVTMVRSAVQPSPPELVRLEGGVAYLRLHDLAPESAARTARLLSEAVAATEGAPGALIIDLRNNPGTLLDEAVSVADLFLSTGTIVTVEGQDGVGERHEAGPEATRYQGRLAVLVDRGTANGAEVVAAALQQNERATVVGEQSFGQGSVQRLIPLSNGGALLLSVAQFYSPDGTAIPGEGVKPDEELELDPDEGKMEPRAGITAEQLATDRYVQRALELLQTENEEQGDLADKAAA
jgi:carboxyl-terminal processing protease